MPAVQKMLRIQFDVLQILWESRHLQDKKIEIKSELKEKIIIYH